MQRHIIGIILISILISKGGIAQSDSLFYASNSSAKKLLITEGIVAVGGISALSLIWYDGLQMPFVFFNDGNEWGGMDKLGHFTGAAWATEWNVDLMKSVGLPTAKARLYSGIATLGFLSFVEVLDGFSPRYGASVYDVLANAGGVAFGLAHSAGQLEKWQLKFSFTRSNYAQYRPNLLGNTNAERWLKDYNGQIYWLSYFPINKWQWLGISAGYGIDGFTGAKANPEGISPNFKRQSEFYLSPDIKLSKLFKEGSKARKWLHYIDFLKIPFPGIQVKSGQLKFKAIAY